MSFCAKIGAVLLLVLAVGCQEVPRYWGGGRVVLAEAAGRKLYAREVKAAIPKGVVGEDSVAFVNRYVEKWVHKQLKLHEAEELFSDAEQDIDSLVEEYRQALLIRKFDQHLIEERIDTLVTADQIAAYHREHASDFKVNQTLVKGADRSLRRQQPAGAEAAQVDDAARLIPAARVRRHLYQEQFRTERFLLFVGDLLRVSGLSAHIAQPELRRPALLAGRTGDERRSFALLFRNKRRASSGRSRTAGAQRGDRAPHPLQPAAERDHSGLRRGGLPKSGRGGESEDP